MVVYAIRLFFYVRGSAEAWPSGFEHLVILGTGTRVVNTSCMANESLHDLGSTEPGVIFPPP